MPTIAQEIAARFGNDGQQWEDEHGEHILDVAQIPAARVTHRGDETRFEYLDESALVICGGGWDLGFPGRYLDCFCWPEAAGGEHHPECAQALPDDPRYPTHD